ncbi:MAG: glycosyltransferase family 2 protein [Methylophilaceae bacterium]|nr:glycosyltransferase family 2 protein [Methylophilaceae bacterium]
MTNTEYEIRASVIVCTYNRANSLTQTLDSLCKQQGMDGIGWEVIVVDNNSKDHTREVIEDKAKIFSQLFYEFEEQQGLSFARNHGIACARGETLLFTDDDVCPESDWVQTILRLMDQHSAEACGGYIAPIWEKEPPTWLTERFYGFLAIKTDMEEKSITQSASAGETPFGANMAFRREVFDRVGVFDTKLGRVGKVLASGEDSELFDRILNSGSKVMYFPQARVHHKVEAFRVRKSYFRRWRFQASRNAAQSQNVVGKRRVFGIPVYLLIQTLTASKRAFVSKLFSAADESFAQEMILWHFLGTLQGLWLNWRYKI